MVAATPFLPDMTKDDTDKVIQRIMYRKRQANISEIEESFRRSVESSGLSLTTTINSSLKRLLEKGRIKKSKHKDPTFKYQLSR